MHFTTALTVRYVSKDYIRGGWGIRTPEGFHPTRFPSVRHRPLGESSGCDGSTRAEQHTCHPNDKLLLAPRVALTWLTPPGRKRSKGNWALVGARGVFCVLRLRPFYRARTSAITSSFPHGREMVMPRGVLRRLFQRGVFVAEGSRPLNLY